jgi:hypothetical protein
MAPPGCHELLLRQRLSMKLTQTTSTSLQRGRRLRIMKTKRIEH